MMGDEGIRKRFFSRDAVVGGSGVGDFKDFFLDSKCDECCVNIADDPVNDSYYLR